MRNPNPTAAAPVQRVRWIAAIGIHPALAWLLPVALAVYAFCAFATHSRADVYAALSLMIVCQALAHLLAIGMLPRHWTLVVAASAVAPLICWRVHHLGQHDTPADAPAESIAAPPQPAPEPTPLVVVTTPATPIARPAYRLRPARVAAPLPPRLRRPTAARPVAASTATPPATTKRAEWATRIAAAQAAYPGATKKEIAVQLGITDRWLRECVRTA
jgi:hypothetical protein